MEHSPLTILAITSQYYSSFISINIKIPAVYITCLFFLLTINPTPVRRLHISTPSSYMGEAYYISVLLQPHLNIPARFQHVQDFAPGRVCTSVYVAEGIGKGFVFTINSMRDLSTDVRNSASPRQSEICSKKAVEWQRLSQMHALRPSLRSHNKQCSTERNRAFSY